MTRSLERAALITTVMVLGLAGFAGTRPAGRIVGLVLGCLNLEDLPWPGQRFVFPPPDRER